MNADQVCGKPHACLTPGPRPFCRSRRRCCAALPGWSLLVICECRQPGFVKAEQLEAFAAALDQIERHGSDATNLLVEVVWAADSIGYEVAGFPSGEDPGWAHSAQFPANAVGRNAAEPTLRRRGAFALLRRLEDARAAVGRSRRRRCD